MLSSIFSSKHLCKSSQGLLKSYSRLFFGAILLATIIIMARVCFRIFVLKETLYYSPEIAAFSGQKIVSFGASHLRYGISPKYFSCDFMNFGIDGMDSVLMKSLVTKVLKDNKTIEHVILELDVVLFTRGLSRFNGDYRFLWRGGLVPSDLDHLLSPIEKVTSRFNYFLAPDFIFSRIKPTDIYSEIRKRKYRIKRLPGHNPMHGIINRKTDGTVRVKAHLKQFKDSMNNPEKNITSFISTIKFLKDKGLKVSLLRLPHHDSYWRAWPESFNKIYNQALSQISATFGKSVSILDFGKASTVNLNDDDFYDGNHLNKNGQSKMSSYLSNIVCP